MSQPIVTLKDLDKKYKKVYERGQAAAEQKNYAYALEMFRDLLRKQPGCLEVRQRLRELQFMRRGGKAEFGHQMLVCTVALPWYIENRILLGKKTPEALGKALDNGEKMMGFDPTALLPILMVETAAQAMELPQVSVQVLEWAVQFHPKSTMLLGRLAQAYMDADVGRKAMQTFQKLVELQPQNPHWQEGLKDAQALAALDRGWKDMEQDKGDFRVGLRDSEEAARLEQAGHTMRTPEGLRQLIDGLQQELAVQDNVDKRRQLAEYFGELRAYDEAIAEYDKVQAMTGLADPTIEQAVNTLRLRQFDDQIRALEEQARGAGSEEERQQAEAQAEELRLRKADTMIDAMRDRVKRFPNQAQERNELGRMLLDKGLLDEALGHFQKLQTHPQFGQSAALAMGRAFAAKGLHDMAIEQFKKVIEGVKNMTALRKEAYYELAKTYDALGQRDEALAAFKAIYAVDMAYRDVGQIIEQHYREQP